MRRLALKARLANSTSRTRRALLSYEIQDQVRDRESSSRTSQNKSHYFSDKLEIMSAEPILRALRNQNFSSAMTGIELAPLTTIGEISFLAVMSCVSLFVIVGNSLTIFVVFKFARLRRDVANHFIASLAVADFLIGAIVMPMAIYQKFLVFDGGSPMVRFCDCLHFVNITSYLSGMFHLMVISMERLVTRDSLVKVSLTHDSRTREHVSLVLY